MPTQTTAPSGKALKRLSGWRRAATLPGALADCALIVPTYRRPKEMVRLLETLAGLPDFPGEVLVVDGSPDLEVEHAILAWADGRSLPFELAWVKSPAGLTRQRNVGLDACNREFIFFLDDDCLPEPGYFRHIRQVFLDDAAGAVGAVRGFLTNGINLPLARLWRLR
ncbi:MAG: glycosyl transferase family 2, partial [Pedosphaera sp.]|nr:glycosyl transferase family 2 [Pedosphaera sp.]